MKRYDLVVIGAGPSGLSAAIEAASHGLNTIVFDENATDAQLQERSQQIFDQVNMRLKAVSEGTGISMGMVVAQPGATFNQLYETSDKALYHAKENGRGHMARF